MKTKPYTKPLILSVWVRVISTAHDIVRDNIERQLIKCRASVDERRTLLDFIFNSSESLIQSETKEEFQERLNELREQWRIIQGRDEARFIGASVFFGWFNHYQANKFRNHLIARSAYFDQFLRSIWFPSPLLQQRC